MGLPWLCILALSKTFLTPQARDSGTPPLVETTNVTVLVMDINDNAPTFPQPSLSATISETVNIGREVCSHGACMCA